MALKVCTQCNKEYKKRSKQAYWQFEKSLYCSRSCKGIAQGFKVVPKQKKNCLVCQKEFEKINHPSSSWKDAKYCSQICYNISRTPEIMEPRYRGAEGQRWKRDILKRDGYKCKMSNGDCTDRLEVHHILRYSEFPELRCDMNNGITLCSFHHPRKKVEENRLAPLFKELLWQL